MSKSKYAIAIYALLAHQGVNCIKFIEGGTEQYEDTISDWHMDDATSQLVAPHSQSTYKSVDPAPSYTYDSNQPWTQYQVPSTAADVYK